MNNNHPPRECKTVHEVIELYLANDIKNLGPHAAKDRRRDLARFDAALGHMAVADLRPFDLLNWLNSNPQFSSNWTIMRVQATMKRVFNWALDMELVSRNPFARIRSAKGGRRNPMSDDHFQIFLRAAPPLFRRFLIFLKFTGCRPIEACTAKWADVRFEESFIRLEHHKTEKKTGKPRLIPLVPTTIKLLLWLKTHRQVSTAELVERLLLPGPMKVTALASQLRIYGASHMAGVRARARLGVLRKRVGSIGPDGYWVYSLPPGYRPRKDWQREEFIFLNYDGQPWKRCALNLRIRRIRQKAGLPKGVSLYGLRHRYGLVGIKNKVNLKLLSLCMGHADVRTTEIYIAEAGLVDEVKEAALQVVYGAGAAAMLPPPPPARWIPTIATPPAPEKIPAESEQLPARNGTSFRPQVPVSPATGNGSNLENQVKALLAKLEGQTVRPAGRRSPSTLPEALTPSQEGAWQAWKWAIGQNPALAKAEDREVYEWLSGRSDFPGKLPPTIVTWARYLSLARAFYGVTKRPELTGRPTMPAPKKGGPT
jgi:integrase